MANDNALLTTKGRLYVFDEGSTQKKFVELSLVDNINVTFPANAVEINSPSGVQVLKTVDFGAQISFDFYHPGDLVSLERLFRGGVSNTNYDGVTAQAGEDVEITFANASEAMPLPGFNGAGTAVTVNSVTLKSDGVTTYAATTDYTLSVDTATGVTVITHVPTGGIAADATVIVNYDYTPLASNILKPDGSQLVERDMMVQVFEDCNDATKYRKIYLPRMTASSDLVMQLLRVSDENQNPNLLSVTMDYARPDSCTDAAAWYIIDSHNV